MQTNEDTPADQTTTKPSKAPPTTAERTMAALENMAVTQERIARLLSLIADLL